MTSDNRTTSSRKRKVGMFLILIPTAVFAVWIAASAATREIAAKKASSNSAQANSSEPWTNAQTVTPAALTKESANTKGSGKPVVVCTGFQFLYEGAHVPGAVFHGPAKDPEGLADLKKWAQGLSRSTNVVIYCGCCPFEKCPNVRPAFEALKTMGFKHLRVLVLPTSFAKDWFSQGYPYDKGK